MQYVKKQISTLSEQDFDKFSIKREIFDSESEVETLSEF
jgi:hypothetical protein